MSKLKVSFMALIAMTIIQLLVSVFIIHNWIIAILSVIALIASIFSFFYIDRYEEK